MSPWLLDNLNHILIGLFGTGFLGVMGYLARLSVKQSVKLYQDELVQAQKKIEGLEETIEVQKETIDIQEQRASVRTALVEDLMDTVDLLKEKCGPAADIATTWQKIPSRRPSATKPSKSDPS